MVAYNWPRGTAVEIEADTASLIAHDLSRFSLEVLSSWAEEHSLAFGLERNGQPIVTVPM